LSFSTAPLSVDAATLQDAASTYPNPASAAPNPANAATAVCPGFATLTLVQVVMVMNCPTPSLLKLIPAFLAVARARSAGRP